MQTCRSHAHRPVERSLLYAVHWALAERDWYANYWAENLLIGVLGGVLGSLLAYVATDFLVAAMPGRLPQIRAIAIDRWVLLFTAGIALLSGLAIGLVPALHLASDKLSLEMQEGSRGGSGGLRQRRMAAALIVSEFALAVYRACFRWPRCE